jgi:magnesium transporter
MTNRVNQNELCQLICSQIQILIEQGNLEGIKTILIPVQPVDIAEVIENLPEAMQVIVFRLLSKTEAIKVYEYLDGAVQQNLIEEFKGQEIRDIVDKMSPDDRARLFDELPAKVVSRLLEQLSPEERSLTNLLLGYEEDTAGRMMTPKYIAVQEKLTNQQTFDYIRGLADTSEVVYYLYLTDNSRHLKGVVSLKDLVISPPEKTLKEIMTKDLVFVHTDTDQEEVAKTIQRYDLLAVPVVDREDRLVGVVTVDDVIDILEQEATEDIYALGGLQTDGDNYFQTNLWTVTRKRVVWLFVLLITNTFTGSIIKSQEDILSKVVTLAAFIPLLTDTGGNVGAQSSTVVIRGLNTEEINYLGQGRIIWREALAGLLLGLGLGTVATIWAYILLHNQDNAIEVSFSVGLSLLFICILSSVAGSALPFLFKRLGFDPALMSAPFITTAVDVLGILIYFYTARVFLNL